MSVDTPAISSATWTRKAVSPLAAPIAPAMISGGATLPTNIASTC